MQDQIVVSCPLCSSQNSQYFHRDKARQYQKCSTCQLVFVPPNFYLSAAEEKAHYDHHQNSPNDAGYRKFLGRTFTPLNSKLKPNRCGLDFGSGPGPTLSIMFEEAGHNMAIYDPFYAPDRSVLRQTYDFITATEVVEHLHTPSSELDLLWSCLRPNGWLAIMTKRVTNLQDFTTWHYKNDPTHVCFYSEETFNWLAKKWGSVVEFHGKDVVMFQKTG